MQNNYIAPIEGGQTIKNPNLTTGYGVKDYSGGRQVAIDTMGNEYQRNEYNIGTPQYYTDWSLTKKTTTPSTGSSSNPIVSGSSTAADVGAVGKDISNLTNTSADATKLLQDRMDALERRRAEEIAGIKASYEEASAAQGQRQAKDYAGRATGLVTSGGGFLGATQSHQGVLQNLEATFQTEKNALMAKRDAAIREAQNAYDDKQFDLAKLKIAEAKDTEKELYTRQKDMADQKLALAKEARSQQEFDMGVTEKKVSAYAQMPDDQFAKLTPEQLAETDKAYYPGYTAAKRNAEREMNDINKVQKIINIKNDVPAGQVFTINGIKYVGTKKATGSGNAIKDPISPSLAYQLQVPEIQGLSTEEVITNLAIENPPYWYIQFYKNHYPDAFELARRDPSVLQNDWKIFKDLAVWTPFKNTVDIDKVNSKSGGKPSKTDLSGIPYKPTK